MQSIEEVLKKRHTYNTSDKVKKRHSIWQKNRYHSEIGQNDYLLKMYGITLLKYNELLELQNHCCKMCGRNKKEFKRKLYVDHNHKCCPGKRSCGKCIRGLLCSPCNASLGHYEKIKSIAEKYLEKNNVY